MAKENFIPVVGDDWYQRRRQDAEGEFFRNVADQGPRKTTPTKQGIYCLTADGKLLFYKNAGQDPAAMRDALKRGLAEWKRLPAEKRRPGAVQVGELAETDENYTRGVPDGGLVVNVYTRILEPDGAGGLKRGKCTVPGGDFAARDHLWLLEREWKSLIPARAEVGAKVSMPDRLTERMLRFHLVDNTRGEPPFWQKEEIRSKSLTLTVESADEQSVQLRLEGSVLLATEAETSTAARGFDARLAGVIQFDRKENRITRFDVVALGEHWGEGTFTREARPGRTPLGIAFELAKGDSAADQVPPQAARDIGDYLGR